jgi:hypothetical protein
MVGKISKEVGSHQIIFRFGGLMMINIIFHLAKLKATKPLKISLQVNVISEGS